jgi:bifunctional non-homologous end joining protein LigD
LRRREALGFSNRISLSFMPTNLFQAVCKLGLEGIVSKRLNAPYRSGPSRTWIKVKNPNAPAATRAIDGTF